MGKRKASQADSNESVSVESNNEPNDLVILSVVQGPKRVGRSHVGAALYDPVKNSLKVFAKMTVMDSAHQIMHQLMHQTNASCIAVSSLISPDLLQALEEVIFERDKKIVRLVSSVFEKKSVRLRMESLGFPGNTLRSVIDMENELGVSFFIFNNTGLTI